MRLSLPTVCRPLFFLILFAVTNPTSGQERLGMEGKTPVERGKTLFDWVWEPTTLPRIEGRADGLGPMFNARSCAECHHQGGSGGSGSIDHNIDIITARPFFSEINNFTGYQFSYSFRFVNGRFEYSFGNNVPQNQGNQTKNRRRESTRTTSSIDPATLAQIHEGFRHSPSVVLHKFSTDKTYRDYRRHVPGRHETVQIDLAERNTPSLFGIGLVDKIDDKVLLAQAAKQRDLGLGGRVARTADGRIGKFGWKSQKATLREFVEEAAAGELGLESGRKHQGSDPRGPVERGPGIDLSQDQIDAMTAYVATLPRPSNIPSDSRTGQRLFRELECAKCHVPKLGEIENFFSDLLLHDMKPESREAGNYLVFGVGEAAPPAAHGESANSPARPNEWRTPPLWGIGVTAPYMHDGRSPTLESAISEHGGEAENSAEKFSRLSDAQKVQLIKYLQSL